MFAARLHDPTPDTFSRQEAASLIPKSNPFLRKLFGKATQMNDPFIHFYEYFLAEYDPKLRKARGVWYTPEPVVNFIVRAVDDILKSEFGLSKGLADNSKIEIEIDTDIFDKKKQKYKKVKKQVHKVQILDPATGTGTFLAEVVKHIYGTKFKNMQGAWPQYVENDLIPRLNGFEILMASYAMAHLKLDLLLGETGYTATSDQRFKIYLTNSLEEANPDTGTLFANWLSTEASEANAIKRDSPVMCVIGNPPYSIKSQNKNQWILNLIKDYKKNLNEKKINLDDDYIKFIRYGQHYISRTNYGVLAYITNNSFIDGITHRQMRKDLLETFDKIYVLNLHGFAKLKEIGLVAENDENVFDIQQGVSINIFIKDEKSEANKDAKVLYKSLYGKRQEKYDYLASNGLDDIDWVVIDPVKPYFFFVEKDFSERSNYEQGFKITDLFNQANSGVKTDRDKLFYDHNSSILSQRISRMLSGDYDNNFSSEFNIKDSGSYKITKVIGDCSFDSTKIQKSTYRPFDSLWTYYDKTLISRPAQKAMKHIDGKENISLIVGRQGQVIGHMDWNLIFCSSTLVDYNVFYRGGGYVFPLYTYEDDTNINFDKGSVKRSNLNPEIFAEICEKVLCDDESLNDSIQPINIFDYIYAFLHSTNYRKRYHEFLKIDFPIIPYPEDANKFWEFVRLGGLLRSFHCLDDSVEPLITVSYPCQGNNQIVRKLTKTSPGFELMNEETKTGKVWINDEQYFDNVPELAWNFYIGGYQPAQKWLKDRKDRTLSYDDIEHYQKIIAALVETDKIMEEIDEVGVV